MVPNSRQTHFLVRKLRWGNTSWSQFRNYSLRQNIFLQLQRMEIPSHLRHRNQFDLCPSRPRSWTRVKASQREYLPILAIHRHDDCWLLWERPIWRCIPLHWQPQILNNSWWLFHNCAFWWWRRWHLHPRLRRQSSLAILASWWRLPQRVLLNPWQLWSW